MSHNKSFLAGLWDFLKTRKKYWLAPIIIMLVLAGIIIILGQSTTVSSFVYALF